MSHVRTSRKSLSAHVQRAPRGGQNSTLDTAHEPDNRKRSQNLRRCVTWVTRCISRSSCWPGLRVIEACALVVLWRLLVRSREEAEELRQRTDARARLLLRSGREAVKTVWNTANIMRKEGFGAAVRSSIEDLADWAEVERPDLARVTPRRPGGDHVLRHRGVHRIERTDRRPRLGQADRLARQARGATGAAPVRACGEKSGRRIHDRLRPCRAGGALRYRHAA